VSLPRSPPLKPQAVHGERGRQDYPLVDRGARDRRGGGVVREAMHRFSLQPWVMKAVPSRLLAGWGLAWLGPS
jgi:hypothetical protein